MLSIEKARKFLDVAGVIAIVFSKDKSTKVGALITTKDGSPLSWGYNGLVRGVNDEVDARHIRPEKYLWAEHAERNAVYNASRAGISLKDSRMFITHLTPCPDCVRAIIQAGVSEIYVEESAFKLGGAAERWLTNWETSKEMLNEAGVTITVVPEYIPEGWNEASSE